MIKLLEAGTKGIPRGYQGDTKGVMDGCCLLSQKEWVEYGGMACWAEPDLSTTYPLLIHYLSSCHYIYYMPLRGPCSSIFPFRSGLQPLLKSVGPCWMRAPIELNLSAMVSAWNQNQKGCSAFVSTCFDPLHHAVFKSCSWQLAVLPCFTCIHRMLMMLCAMSHHVLTVF